MGNQINFTSGDFAVSGTTLDDIFIELIIIIMLGIIAGSCIFRNRSQFISRCISYFIKHYKDGDT